MGILRFVNSSVIFPDSLPDSIHFKKFLILLTASCDSAHEVVDGGENGLKRMKKPDMEDKMVFKDIFRLIIKNNSVVNCVICNQILRLWMGYTIYTKVVILGLLQNKVH
jgi:hypothetical protein